MVDVCEENRHCRMGKVYAKELRQVEDELNAVGFVSGETRHQAMLIQPVDVSNYPIRTIFEVFKGIRVERVSEFKRYWQNRVATSTVDILLTRAVYAQLLAHATDIQVDTEEGKLLVQQQFKAFARSSRHMNALEFFGGLALLSEGSFDGKALLVFSLFDFKREKSLSRDDAVVMVDTCLRGLSCLKEDMPVPDIAGVEWLVDGAFKQYLGGLKAKMSSRVVLDWCRYDATIGSVLKKASVENDQERERVIERKENEQKELLEKLAKIEKQLQVTYLLPRFEHDSLQETLQSSRTAEQSVSSVDARSVQARLPQAEQFEDGSESLVEEDVRGLTLKIYELMNDTERQHWRASSNMLRDIQGCIARTVGNYPCSFPTSLLHSLIELCSLEMKGTPPQQERVQADSKSFFQWVGSWSLPVSVITEATCDEVRNLWAWTRVLLPSFVFIFYTCSALMLGRFHELVEYVRNTQVFCEPGDCTKTTKVTATMQKPNTLASHFTVTYCQNGVDVKTGFYEDLKPMVTDEEAATLSEYAL